MKLNSTVAALGFALAVSMFGGVSVHAEENKPTELIKVEPIVAVVKPGDYLSLIADEYKTTYVRIYNANENIVNPDIINPGDKLRIPLDDEVLPDRMAQVSTVAVATQSASTASVSRTATKAGSYTPTSTAGNTYTWGNCTWYVKNRKPNIPNSFGNANQWISRAQAAGYATGSTPVVGAIGASGNHVVYVESISGAMVNISEMNYNGGVGIVHYRTVPASSFYYIYA